MKCPNCRGKMVKDSQLVWSDEERKYIDVWYWWCRACGTLVLL